MLGSFKKILDSFWVKIEKNGTPRVFLKDTEIEVMLEKREKEYYIPYKGVPVAVSMHMFYTHYSLDSKERIMVNFAIPFNYNTISYVILQFPSYTPFFLKGNFYRIENIKTGEVKILDKITDVCIVLGKTKIELYKNIFNDKLHGDLKIEKVVGNGVSNSLYEGGFLSDDSLSSENLNDSDEENLVDLNL